MIQKRPVTNLLLESLPTTLRLRVLKLCTTVKLEFGTVVCEAGQPYQHVYFPLTGFVSSLAAVVEHPPLEIGLIGNEGMIGVGTLLGVNNAPLQLIVQGSGSALRIPVAQFTQELRINPDLVILLNRYIYASIQQLAQAAVCINFHEVDARLARWLLMTNDRAHANTFDLTHAFLAHMLGVRRSSVSIAASKLRKKSIISYSRGKIKILDRKRLETVSCSCYSAIKVFYSALL